MPGPQRPVLPPPPDSICALFVTVRGLLEQPARRHLLTGTLCVALDDVARITGPAVPLTVAAPRTLTAVAIATMAYRLGPDLAGDPGRFDHRTRLGLTDVVLNWVTGPHRYVDPGHALTRLLAGPVGLVGGWPAVADDELQAGRHADLLARFVTPPSPPRVVTRLGVWAPAWSRTEVSA